MIITIKRIRKKTSTRCTEPVEVIDGQLYIEGMHICDCAENTKSAIKAGTYPVVITKCKQYARKMPIILVDGEGIGGEAAIAKGNPSPSPKCYCCPKLDIVSNNTSLPILCPQLKPGNGVYHRTDGSIIVGTYIAPGCLAHPKEAFDTIYDRIRKNVERGNEVSLIIEEHYPEPREFSPFEMGTQILAQMSGINL